MTHLQLLQRPSRSGFVQRATSAAELSSVSVPLSSLRERAANSQLSRTGSALACYGPFEASAELGLQRSTLTPFGLQQPQSCAKGLAGILVSPRSWVSPSGLNRVIAETTRTLRLFAKDLW